MFKHHPISLQIISTQVNFFDAYAMMVPILQINYQCNFAKKKEVTIVMI